MTAPDATPAPRYEIYTVASGDSLSKIAKHYYNDASRWHAIYEANKDQIDNPDMIQVGQVIQIPLD
jgi:nucleoid-associated protein YgaU